jgi:ribosome-binding factor A
MAYKRADRVNALLQRELGMIISEELRDPRIAFATVTGVEITSDLRTAKVHVSVLGDEEQVKSTITALNEARPYLRHEIGERTELRYVPDLTFVSDQTAERAARISTLLREAKMQGGATTRAGEGAPVSERSERAARSDSTSPERVSRPSREIDEEREGRS